MGKVPVKFFYDIVSPYTIFAYKVLLRYESRWDIAVHLRPVFLGGIMKGSDNKPPGLHPVKFVYLQKDAYRCAKYFDIPFKFPQNMTQLMFENGTLPSLRYLTAVGLEKPDKVRAVTDALVDRIWVKDEDVMSPEGIMKASLAAGFSQEESTALMAQTKTDAIKDKLKQTTQEALDYGAFGVPTFILKTADGPHMVFGSDRFPIIADLLGTKWEGPNPDVSSKL